MTTQNQIDANRLNAQKSTGPRTPEGKSRSAQNALKHGLLAQRTILVDEDEDQFDDIRRALFEDLSPDGPFEILLVERIVAQYWRLQRTLRMETALIEVLAKNQSQSPGLTRTLKYLRKYPDKESIDENNDLVIGLAVADDLARETRLLKMQQYEARIENGFYRALRQLHEFRKYRPKPATPAPAPNEPNFSPGPSSQPVDDNPNPTPTTNSQSSIDNNQSKNEPDSFSEPSYPADDDNPNPTSSSNHQSSIINKKSPAPDPLDIEDGYRF
jgi:hypothetical protein